MHLINRTRRKPAGTWKAAAVLTVLLLIGLGLAACGSSGSSTTTATNANAAATTGSGAGPGTVPNGPSGPTGARSRRFGALRECLAKNGVKFPPRTPGQRPRGGFLGGATGLPDGVTRGQVEAALKKCGGLFGGGLRRFNNPARRQALAKFAACMRENGVNVPEPNTSGTGPVFSTKGLQTNSTQFRTAEAKCRVDLGASFGARGGGAASGPGG
jgi:hypothetical protein